MRDAVRRIRGGAFDEPGEASLLRDAAIDGRITRSVSSVRLDAELGCAEPRTFPVLAVADLAAARDYARSFAGQAGFKPGDQIVVDAVIDEMGTNMLEFAGAGELVVGANYDDGRAAMTIIARDRGPGIPDVTRAFTDGYSTSGRPGLGLATSRRLMDSFELASAPGEGTTITMKKWRERPN